MMNLQKFYANMDWWNVAEQPLTCSKLCEKFRLLEIEWLADKASRKRIVQELSPFLKSSFIVSNISNFQSIFETNDIEVSLEVNADKVVIVDLDFSSKPLPLCKSEAFYTLPVKSDFKKIDLEEWQEYNSRFYDAITFYWDFGPNFDMDCDLSFGANSGVECIPID
jgi:hypothetical protein